MSNERDENGELLPDEVRLTSFGRFLRSTSLDELPEFQRPTLEALRQPLEDGFVTIPRVSGQSRYLSHDVRPGLTGLAQINGRNALGWEQRFAYDLEYVNHCTFLMDLKIIGMTLGKVLKRSGTLSGADQTVADFDVYRREQNRNGEK